MAKYSLITGAANGIGLKLAKLIAADGYNLVLVDVHEQALAKAARELAEDGARDIVLISQDLATEDGAREVFNCVRDKNLNVDLLVNNAGYGVHGRFNDRELDEHLQMIHLNIDAVIKLTYYFLPQMISRGGGGIINLGSIASFEPGPLMSTYFASKAFVLSWSVALAVELDNQGIMVSCLCPGPTDTSFASTAGAEGSLAFSSGVTMDSDQVAAEGYEGFKSGHHIVVPGWHNKLAALASRLLPHDVVAGLAGRINCTEPGCLSEMNPKNYTCPQS